MASSLRKPAASSDQAVDDLTTQVSTTSFAKKLPSQVEGVLDLAAYDWSEVAIDPTQEPLLATLTHRPTDLTRAPNNQGVAYKRHVWVRRPTCVHDSTMPKGANAYHDISLPHQAALWYLKISPLDPKHVAAPLYLEWFLPDPTKKGGKKEWQLLFKDIGADKTVTDYISKALSTGSVRRIFVERSNGWFFGRWLFEIVKRAHRSKGLFVQATGLL